MKASRSAEKVFHLVLRMITIFATDISMVRPEGTHSKLLSPGLPDFGSADSAHHAVLKPG